MLHQFRWVLDENCPEGCYAYIRFKNVDINSIDHGSIYISSKIIEEPDFTAQNLLFILMHELLHIIFLHGPRMGDRNPVLWNLAGDQVINSLLKRQFQNLSQKSMPVPFKGYGTIGGCICYEEIKGVKVDVPGITIEQIYDLLKQESDKYKFTKISSANGIDTYEVENTETGEKFRVSINQNTREKTSASDRFYRLSKEIYNSSRRGNESGDLYEVFNEFFKSEIPWDDVLRDIIKKSIVPVPNGRGWKTLNKMFLPLGYTLPGVIYDEEVKIDTAIISIDTSGSIGTKELQKFADILVESMDFFKELILICHDSTITQEEKFTSDRKEELKKYISDIGFRGRGGTSHNDVFKRIEEINSSLYEGVSIVLSLTDGYSDIPESWNKYEWSRKNEIPICFIITEHGSVPNICSTNREVKHVKIN